MNGLFNLSNDDDILGFNIDEEPMTESTDEEAKQSGFVSVSAKKTEITSDQYAAALKALQKSFAEGAELMAMLSEATISDEDEGNDIEEVSSELVEEQKQYVESVLDEALLLAYDDGPMYEAVDRDDKKTVKDIVKKLRKEIPKIIPSDNGVKFVKAHTFLRLLLNIPGFSTPNHKNDNEAGGSINWFTTRFWQVLGVIYTENESINSVIETLNDEFADALGEYKILYQILIPTIYDAFKLRFGWKNRKNAYFLIIDKKMPKEFKQLQKEVGEAIKVSSEEFKDDTKEEPKKEEIDK